MIAPNYIDLFLCWCAFCFFHSFFAALWVKKIIAARTGKYFMYYRPLYAMASLIFLIFLLLYQIEKKETVLFFVTPLVRAASIVLIPGGLILMGFSAFRYFVPVTGLSIFTKKKSSDGLLEIGIHGVIRHPLYAGTLLFIWGLFLIFPFTSNLISCIVITIYTFIGIKLEEKKLLLQYGKAYGQYRRRVPMMIPNLHLRSVLKVEFNKLLARIAHKKTG
ncbi:MAG TPA: isoprenylcysteine carboxylmethyltransferase family protein [Puia sp.]|nr:isoprenylcysteine carboxylmethyltransferase family protein [Puia sp.]